MIWYEAVTDLFEKESEDNLLRLRHGEGVQPSITRTCKQIRAESILMFYANNTFYIKDIGFYAASREPDKSLELARRWLRAVPREYHAVTKGLEIGTSVRVPHW